MADILSHAEVEAILSAIEPSRPIARSTAVHASADSVVWEPHDFRRPALEGRGLQVVQALHAGICQRWGRSLESLLQSRIEIRPVGVCQSTASEFLGTLSPQQQVVCQIRHASTTADSLIVWSDRLAQSLFARMLGGDLDATSEPAKHSLTDIELRLLARLNEAVLRELSTLLDDTLEVKDVVQSVQFVSEDVAKFPNVWFSFEVIGCGARDLIHLAIPGVPMNSPDTANVTQTPIAADAVPAGIRQISVQVSASLATLKIKASDLAALEVGDVVMTDLSPTETVSLRLEGRDLCQASIGTHLGRKALRLVEFPISKAD